MNNRNICTICYLNNSTIGCTKCNYKICIECSNKLKKNECPGCRNPDKEWRKNLETNKVIINITEEFPENIEITESYIQPNMNYNENLENSITNLRYFNCLSTIPIPILNDEEIEERIYRQNKCIEIINYIIKIKIKVLLILLICLILGFITTIWSGTDYKYILKYNYNMILMLLILRGLIFIVSMLILMIICIIIENKTGFLSKLKNCLYSGPGDA